LYSGATANDLSLLKVITFHESEHNTWKLIAALLRINVESVGLRLST
jgi:hypothetical protein